MKIAVNGQWRDVANAWVAVNGQWKPVVSAKVAVNGQWKDAVGLGSSLIRTFTAAPLPGHPYSGFRLSWTTNGVVPGMAIFANGQGIYLDGNVTTGSFDWYVPTTNQPAPGVPYTFDVWVSNGVVTAKDPHLTQSKKSLAFPPAPSSVTVSASAALKMQVVWPKVAGVEDYRVVATAAGETTQVLEVSGTAATLSAVLNAAPATKYSVRVVSWASNVAGSSKTVSYTHHMPYVPGWRYFTPTNADSWSNMEGWVYDTSAFTGSLLTGHGYDFAPRLNYTRSSFFYWTAGGSNPFASIHSLIADGGRITRARFSVQRVDTSVDVSYARSVSLQTHNSKVRPLSTTTNVSVDGNAVPIGQSNTVQQKWLDIPVSLAKAVIANSGKGFTLSATDPATKVMSWDYNPNVHGKLAIYVE